MLNLAQYPSLGAALSAAIAKWPDELCLIEADRERENIRLTYRQFHDSAMHIVRTLQAADFSAGDRAAIVMTNQSKWLISAYAVFYCGGILVPLDYKLTAAEHVQLLAHCKARVLIVEHHLWRALNHDGAELTLVTEAPPAAELGKARRWENCGGAPQKKAEPRFIGRRRQDPACIVYSSGTGGRPKGCVLTHDNYIEQCLSVAQIWQFAPGVRYLSILPANHAIDFMGGFIMPFTGGGTVVHLRTLRPEFVREAFSRYKIHYMALVPLILKNLENGLREKFAALSPAKRRILNLTIALNRTLTAGKPRLMLSRRLLSAVHRGFGSELRGLLVGGAFTEPSTLAFFHDLGIPVANGYGCTEACTAITVNDQSPFRPDSVGKPVRGMEIRIAGADAEGVGEVMVRSRTVMSHYLDDPEATAEVLSDGWLKTGDLGRLTREGCLQLMGRKKNMIVTEEGKNIYPEDLETVFEGLPVKEFCVFAANYIWPQRSMTGEQLLLVLRLAGAAFGQELRGEVEARNRRLSNYKRINGCVVWEQEFPRTASLKIKRPVLAEQIRGQASRASAVVML